MPAHIPWPLGWDAKLVASTDSIGRTALAMVDTCGVACRQALGFKERVVL